MNLKTKAMKQIADNPFEPCVDSREVDLNALGASAMKKYQLFFREGADWGGLVYQTEPRFISMSHHAVKLLVANDATLFSVVMPKYGCYAIAPEALALTLADIFGADFQLIRREYPMHRFSPYFEVLESTKFNFQHQDLKGIYTRPEADRLAKSLNKRVKALRRRLRDPKIVQGYSNFRRSPVENFNGLMACMQRAVEANSKQLIVRFDCHYQVNGLDPTAKDIEVDIEELPKVQKCRDRFHRSIDRKLAGALRGFAFCLEYGQHRRWHYHYLLFVDPSYTDDDVALVESFRAIWLSVTEGKGELFNVNAQKKKHRFQAIGFVDTTDERVQVGLRAIASYFTLAGLYVQLKLPKRVKTFGKGRFPAPQAKPGRPLKRPPSRLRISLPEARNQIRFI
nr:hypothetical protein [uncultured Roseateles sp.]